MLKVIILYRKSAIIQEFIHFNLQKKSTLSLCCQLKKYWIGIPRMWKCFRPVLAQPLNPVSEGQVRDAVVSWLGWTQQQVQDQGSLLLQQLCSLRSLQGLRDPPTVSCENIQIIYLVVVYLHSNITNQNPTMFNFVP